MRHTVNKLFILAAAGTAVKPAYYSDNFFTLLPHGNKTVTIEMTSEQLSAGAVLDCSGWNVHSLRVLLAASEAE